MTRKADSEYPVHELISQRWSPVGFDDRMVPRQDLCSLFEAARWAASSYNEQPSRFIVATKDDAQNFENVLSCLVAANQVWAKNAPVLVLCCTNLYFERNGKANAAAKHDLGLAVGNLSLEATARGLSIHQMIGILPDKARQLFDVPAEAEVVTALAIGYAADPNMLPEPLKQRDTAPRYRKPISSFIFTGKWGTCSPFVQND